MCFKRLGIVSSFCTVFKMKYRFQLYMIDARVGRGCIIDVPEDNTRQYLTKITDLEFISLRYFCTSS